MQQEVTVPDIGEYADVDIIDVLVKVGDVIAKDDVLITLETEKATMDIPAPYAGKIEKMHVAVGGKASKGTLILTLAAAGESEVNIPKPDAMVSKETVTQNQPRQNQPKQELTKQIPDINQTEQTIIYASPSIRRFARNLGVNLMRLVGTGRKQRITKVDVENYVRYIVSNSQINQGENSAAIATNPQIAMSGANQKLITVTQNSDKSGTTGLTVMPFKPVDFTKFGEVVIKPLARIKKISGATLHRNWVHIPHVTQFDEADITELEDFRVQQKTLAEKRGVKLTPLVFLLKAVVAGLKQFPNFNASINLENDTLILKKYFHIGVAVDTPDGLVVPVINNVDSKGILELAAELASISQQAREGKLTAAQMQGGCFTISSLGGIGGTGFTPIINAPEVAILGVCKSKLQPVYVEGSFVPKLILPLAVSYDHRVIDGAEAVRFTSFLVRQLADIRYLLL